MGSLAEQLDAAVAEATDYRRAAALPDEIEALKATEEKEKHDKKRKLQLMAETETAGLMVEDNQALRRCEEVHAATQQPIAAMEAVAQRIVCSDTMKQASTVSGCGPTFCRSCLHRGGFACGRVLAGVFAACMAT